MVRSPWINDSWDFITWNDTESISEITLLSWNMVGEGLDWLFDRLMTQCGKSHCSFMKGLASCPPLFTVFCLAGPTLKGQVTLPFYAFWFGTFPGLPWSCQQVSLVLCSFLQKPHHLLSCWSFLLKLQGRPATRALLVSLVLRAEVSVARLESSSFFPINSLRLSSPLTSMNASSISGKGSFPNTWSQTWWYSRLSPKRN